jgi:ATP-binding cassette subfamily F protein 1
MDDASPGDTNENTNEDTNETNETNETDVDTRRTSIRKNERAKTRAMSESEWRSAAARLGEIGDELEQRGAYAAEADARRILTGLGFDETRQNKPLSQLSGGWRMRAALAVALFLRPGLLLLDEPTNHLDLPATIWLASYLNSRECANTAVLLVTHSADFVAETATHLVHLDHFKKKLVVQKHADVWRFLAAAPERFKQEKARYEAQRARLKNLKTKSGLSGDAATKRVLKEEGKSRIAKKKANGANGANVEPLADADGLLLKPREYQVSFTFPASEDDRPTIAVLDACFAIPDPGAKVAGEKLVDFKNLRFSVHARSKIVLVGPNGCGKSTLLKLLMGDVRPDAGEVHIHRDLRIGRHDQHHDASFDFGDDGGPSESRASAAALLEKTFGVANQDARRLLGQSGLESSAHVVPFAKLSGGQKSRVAFAALCAKPQNLLLLDEPTNHLDLESVEALIDGLNKFEGGVVVSTHDARLAEGLNDAEIWLVGAEGSTTGVDVLGRAGDAKPFARYRARVAAEVEAATEETKRRAAQRRRGAKERGARFS